jgi:hypothetical protein
VIAAVGGIVPLVIRTCVGFILRVDLLKFFSVIGLIAQVGRTNEAGGLINGNLSVVGPALRFFRLPLS